MVQLVEAKLADIDRLLPLLIKVSDDLREMSFLEDDYRTLIQKSFNENVHWFLFVDDDGCDVGICHLQSLFSYWRHELRFHLGGLYIEPKYRHTGLFVDVYQVLQEWVKLNGGVQIMAHISENNIIAQKAAAKVGLLQRDHQLYVDFLE